MPAAWNRGMSAAGADSMAVVPERIPNTPIWVRARGAPRLRARERSSAVRQRPRGLADGPPPPLSCPPRTQASLTATELDRLFKDFTFSQRDGARGTPERFDEDGNPLPTRAEDIMRFAEENSKPGQTRAEALMSIAASVAKARARAEDRADSAGVCAAATPSAAALTLSPLPPPPGPAQDAPPSVKRSDLLMELAETVSREARGPSGPSLSPAPGRIGHARGSVAPASLTCRASFPS